MTDVSLSLLVLKTHQMDSLRTFYNTLGIEFAKEQHGKGPVHYAGQVGDAVFEIYPLPDQGTSADTSTRLGFGVGQLNQVVDRLETIGSAVVTKPKQTAWGYRAVVRDPDGRAVELYEQ